MNGINFFGETNFRNINRRFGIKADDRRRHFYAIGKTGMGKTEMLKNMAVHDIQAGHGIGFVDPHGEAAEELLDYIPKERAKDVIYFNPSDTSYPIAFNVMENVDPEYRHLVASGLMSVFKKIWPDVWSARMEYILNNVILALLDVPDSTLLGINRVLSDVDYRKEVVEQIRDPIVKAFWVQEYARYTQRYEVEATAAIQNKIGQFVSNPLIRNIVGQQHSTIDMRKVMDEEQILIANISKGRIGEDNSRLLGALLITKLQLAAMARVDMREDERKDFYLYIDEFQNFATESFINILSEARKYHLCLILSHQYIAQLEEGVSEAVFGNVGTIVSFRVGAEDAEALEKEFNPEFYINDFVNLGKYHIYTKLMIDGLASRPFSAETLPPAPLPFSSPEESQKATIISKSREQYGTPVQEVVEIITKWTGIEGMVERAAAAPSSPSPESSDLYDAVCSNCGKDTKVVFPPDGKRPVYCKSCRKKFKSQQKKKDSQEKDEGESQRESTRNNAVEAPATKERVTTTSLQEVLSRDPRRFHSQQKPRSTKERGKRKDVNQEGLKKALQGALDGRIEAPKNQGSSIPQQKTHKKTGVIQPGETIYF